MTLPAALSSSPTTTLPPCLGPLQGVLQLDPHVIQVDAKDAPSAGSRRTSGSGSLFGRSSSVTGKGGAHGQHQHALTAAAAGGGSAGPQDSLAVAVYGEGTEGAEGLGEGQVYGR